MLEILSTILGSLDKKVILPSSAHPSIFKRTQVRDLCCMYAIITFIRRWVKSESRNSSGYDTYRLGAPIFYIVAHYNPERAASRRVVKLYLDKNELRILRVTMSMSNGCLPITDCTTPRCLYSTASGISVSPYIAGLGGHPMVFFRRKTSEAHFEGLYR